MFVRGGFVRPTANSYTVQIPVTLDVVRRQFGLPASRWILAIGLLLGWLVLAVLVWFADWMWYTPILFDIVSFIAVELLVRFCVLQEARFMKIFRMMKENGNSVPYSTFWNIYEITKGDIPICRFRGGVNAVFVRFDKDVIVGRSKAAKHLHYEALASAYQLLHRYGISFMHVDYMDVVGKDSRVDDLLTEASQVENAELRSLMLRIFDGVKQGMSRSYTSCDVYVFYFMGKDSVFLDHLDDILGAFLEANFSAFHLLGSNELGDLFRVLTSASDFTVQVANETILQGNTPKYLVPIWYEDILEDGSVHREILNLTAEERLEKQGVAKAEHVVRKSRASRDARKKLQSMGDIQLGDSENVSYFEKDPGSGVGASGADVSYGEKDSGSGLEDIEIKL